MGERSINQHLGWSGSFPWGCGWWRMAPFPGAAWCYFTLSAGGWVNWGWIKAGECSVAALPCVYPHGYLPQTFKYTTKKCLPSQIRATDCASKCQMIEQIVQDCFSWQECWGNQRKVWDVMGITTLTSMPVVVLGDLKVPPTRAHVQVISWYFLLSAHFLWCDLKRKKNFPSGSNSTSLS